MGRHWIGGGYSAAVELYLLVNGNRLPLSHVGPKSFRLRSWFPIPPKTDATLLIVVDGHEEHRHVFIQHGAADGAERIEYI